MNGSSIIKKFLDEIVFFLHYYVKILSWSVKKMKLFHFGIKSAAVALGAASLFGLSACSDDSSSNSNALDFDVIETLTEADSCRTEIAGDSIFVKDEAQVYVCKDSVWEKVNLEISSSSEKSSAPASNASIIRSSASMSHSSLSMIICPFSSNI